MRFTVGQYFVWQVVSVESDGPTAVLLKGSYVEFG
ncbi:hypothetical protein FOXB_06001 [Fusarium oxysporum f. sp. conglutinans Fo5176]|uniref:Uncharacterized protein n=1 Tax=Fusarium oxysporum (strain Fo5176) TaxID=660025 RepID=F9FHX2_FUSOF|nr:hypothetical protein FOXB_06001 [Fusarium oxysporum f. sp. conglutinans Fo5176]